MFVNLLLCKCYQMLYSLLNKYFFLNIVVVVHMMLTCAGAVTLCFSARVTGCAGTGAAEVLCAGGTAAERLSETG